MSDASVRSTAARPRSTGWLERVMAAESTWVAVAGLAGLVASFVALRLWHASLSHPFSYGGDSAFYQAVVKGVLDHGWVVSNPDLGAPSGLDLQDFPLFFVAVVPFAIIKLIGLLSGGDLPVTINLYYVLTYGLASASAFLLFRWLRVSRLVAVACGVIFAIAPYHLWHGQGHLLATSYYLVPAGVYLALALVQGDGLFGVREAEQRRLRRWLTPRSLATVGLCVLVGWSDIYYVAFSIVLVLGAGLVAALTRRATRPMLVGVVLACTMAAATSVALTPALLYRLDHGANPEVAKRGGGETEIFSTNISQLVLPVPGHPIDTLDGLQRRYREQSRVGAEPTPLGLAATIGFVWLALVALVALTRSAGRPSAFDDPRDRGLSLVMFLALIFATTGGVASLVAYVVTPQLRDSGRMSIFIALLSLGGLALLLDRAAAAIRRRRRVPSVVIAGALAGVVALALVDQTNWALVPKYAAEEAKWRTDQQLVDAVESTLPAGAKVFQTPYLPFPETRPVFGLGDSGHFVGYLHSDDLEWSYASMRGRPADWQATFADRPAAELVPAIAAAGFQGLWLDRSGYADNGEQAVKDLRNVIGYDADLEREDDGVLFWDLRRYADALRERQGPERMATLAASTLAPVRWQYSKGFHEREVGPEGSFRWAIAPESEITFENDSSERLTQLLRMKLARPGGTPAYMSLTLPDGRSKSLGAGPEGTPVRETVELPPGKSRLQLHVIGAPISEGPEGRKLYVQVQQLQLVDPSTLAIR